MSPTIPLTNSRSRDGRRVRFSTKGISVAYSAPSTIKPDGCAECAEPAGNDASRTPVPNRNHCAETPNHSASASSLGCAGIASANNHLRTVWGVTVCLGNRWLKIRAICVGLETGNRRRSTSAFRRWLNSIRSCSLVTSMTQKLPMSTVTIKKALCHSSNRRLLC